MNDNTISNLSQYIRSEFPKANARKIFQLSVSYLLQTINSREFHSSMKQVPGVKQQRIKAFRLLIKRSGYVVLNFRAFLFHVMRIPDGLSEGQKRKKVLKIGRKYGISDRDIRNTLHPSIYDNSDFISQVLSLIKEEFRSVVDVTMIRMKMQRMHQPLWVHAFRYARKKLLFISKNFNMELKDLASEMVMKSVEAYYWSLPTNRSDEHTLNFLRRTCTNHGINMIKYYTANRRARLKSNTTSPGEFVLKEVSENQFKDHEVSYENLPGQTVLVDNYLNFSVTETLHTYRNKPKTVLFLRMLMGVKNDVFSRWLRNGGYINRREDNEILLNRSDPVEYIQLVSEFLNIEMRKVNVFLSHLRRELA